MNTSPKISTIKFVIMFIALIIFIIIFSLFSAFYPKQASPIFSSLLILNMARIDLQKWLKEVESDDNNIRYKRWYKQVHSIAALMWLAWAVALLLYFFVLRSSEKTWQLTLSLFLVGIVFFLSGYTLFLYIQRFIKARKGKR